MKFDPTKPVQTANGKPARIITTDRKGTDFPIVALIMQEGAEFVEMFNRNGFGYYYNLINIPPPKRKAWFNIYPAHTTSYESVVGFGFTSRERADRDADYKRIACLEVEYEEGEGLS
jgi:hypothetical protein